MFNAQPRARCHVAASMRRRDSRASRNSRRPGPSKTSQAAARSVAGSPAVRSPKSITAESLPPVVMRLAGCRSPCSQSAGPFQPGAAHSCCQSRAASAASGSSAASEASRRRTSASRARSGTPRTGLAGACGGAGCPNPARKAASWPAQRRRCAAGCPAAVVPSIQRSTDQCHGKNGDGVPQRSGAGTDISSPVASFGSQVCSCSTSGAAAARRGSLTASASPSRKMALSQPVAAERSGRAARSGNWSASRRRTRPPLTRMSAAGMPAIGRPPSLPSHRDYRSRPFPAGKRA